MALNIQKAVRESAKLRMALIGPPGSGKTWTALEVASGIGKKILLIDTEGRSSTWYADDFEFDMISFSDIEREPYHPVNYVDAIKMGEKEGYEVIIIDSLSHAWTGEGGALDLANKETQRSKSSNSYVAWRNVTPLHNRLVDSILQSKCHIIATIRSKEKRVMDKDERGRTVIRTIGLEGVQRDGLNYEFGIVGDLDQDHNLIITKTRVKFLDNAIIHNPDRTLGVKVKEWLESGQPNKETPKPVASVESEEESIQEPTKSRVADLADKVQAWLASAAVEGNHEKAAKTANEMVSFKFNAPTMWDVSDDDYDEFRLFARGELVKILKADGLVK